MTTYRTCPRSGLQFDTQAEKLMLANAVAGVVFLLLFFGVMVPMVVYSLWGVIEILTVPLAK